MTNLSTAYYFRDIEHILEAKYGGTWLVYARYSDSIVHLEYRRDPYSDFVKRSVPAHSLWALNAADVISELAEDMILIDTTDSDGVVL